MWYILLTDVYCSDPINVAHSIVEGLESRDPVTGLFKYATVLRYDCENGRRFEDGLTSNYIQCQLHGVWNQTHYTCQCKSAILC